MRSAPSEIIPLSWSAGDAQHDGVALLEAQPGDDRAWRLGSTAAAGGCNLLGWCTHQHALESRGPKQAGRVARRVGMLAPADAFPAAAEQDHGWDSDA